MKSYTVVWSPSAEKRLGELWLDNPAIAIEITRAVDTIETGLGHNPYVLSVSAGPRRCLPADFGPVSRKR